MTARRVIAVGGGKGGVGKSFVSANLAVTMARQGKRVVVLDADLGGANMHTLFRVLTPERTVHDFLDGKVDTLDEATIPSGVDNLRIIAGTCEVLGSADLGRLQRARLLGALARLDTDVLLIDVGAGTNTQTVDLFNAADTRLVVLTPELTSSQNAYGFLKVAIYRRFQRVLARFPSASKIRERLGDDAYKAASNLQKVGSFFALVEEETPELLEPLRGLLAEFDAKLVGNMLTKDVDRNVLFALRRLIANFLDLDVEVAAAFRSSSKVRASVNAGRPLAAGPAKDYDAAEFARLARTCLDQDFGNIEKLRENVVTALAEEGADFAFGLDGIESVEIEEVTDPEQLAEIEAAAAAEPDSASQVPMPSPPPPPPPVASTKRTSPPPPLPPDAVRREEDDSGRPSELGPSRFMVELSKVTRRSNRGITYVEVQMSGHWIFGQLVSIDDRGAIVSGVHPTFPGQGAESALRLVTMRAEDEDRLPPAVSTRITKYDPDEGLVVLIYDDPPAAVPIARFLLGEALEATPAA